MGSWPQAGSLQALSVGDGPKTYTQDAKKGKRNTRVGEPSCHLFSLSKTRLGEKEHAVALWDFTARVLEGFNKTFLSEILMQNKWQVGLCGWYSLEERTLRCLLDEYHITGVKLVVV